MPAGTSLMHLPGRRPLGLSPTGATVAVDESGALAVAAVLPPGYLRTWLPAYEEDGRPPVLPLYGYAAVASIDGEPHVAAMRTDRWNAWNPQAEGRRDIDAAIRSGRRALPASRLLRQLETCATEDRKSTCLNSSHVSISYAVFCLKKKK